MENNCPHYDYGKSADTSLGAYCARHKKLVDEDGCEGCVNKKEAPLCALPPKEQIKKINELADIFSHSRKPITDNTQ